MSDRNEGTHEAERAWLEIEAAAIWELEALGKRDGREKAISRRCWDASREERTHLAARACDCEAALAVD